MSGKTSYKSSSSSIDSSEDNLTIKNLKDILNIIIIKNYCTIQKKILKIIVCI